MKYIIKKQSFLSERKLSKKTNEDTILEYKTGDYVLLNMKSLDKTYGKGTWGDMMIDNYPKEELSKIVGIYRNDNFPYIVKNDKNINFYLRPRDIIRLLTPEEIELYKIKKEAKKYNL